MAAPTRPITRESVETELTACLARLRESRDFEDFTSVEVHEAELNLLLGRWKRLANPTPEPKPSHL